MELLRLPNLEVALEVAFRKIGLGSVPVMAAASARSVTVCKLGNLPTAASISTAWTGVAAVQIERRVPHHPRNNPGRNPGSVGQGRHLATERMEVEDAASGF